MADSVKMVYNRQSCRKAPQAFISCLISFMYNSRCTAAKNNELKPLSFLFCVFNQTGRPSSQV